jgi:HlyD family secretion protein
MKKLLVFLVSLWGAGAAGFWYWNDSHAQPVAFRTAPVTRGSLTATINATGTLEPEEVVDVGTQIAGEIRSFGTDTKDPKKPISYGSAVDEGTVLARLNDSLLKARLDQSKASLSRAEGELEQAEVKAKKAGRDFERVRKLHARNQVPPQEFDDALAEQEVAKANVSVAKGAVELAKANLEEATVNLGYTTIRSPVKGVILDRRVNIGQTVVASLNAPSLFLIAKDLTRMEAWALVNETDVGAIHVGQPVRFTVAAFPDESFPGKVSQIRLNASMTQSVVTYTVVIDVDNKSGKLLPYLTARLAFEVQDRKDVLRVPNAALRWQPKVAHVAEEEREAFEVVLRQKALAPRSEKPRPSPDPKTGTPAIVWVRQGEFVHAVPVKVGMTDGVLTEVLSGDVTEGTEVVMGLASQQADDAGGSPFLPKIKNDKAKK